MHDHPEGYRLKIVAKEITLEYHIQRFSRREEEFIGRPCLSSWLYLPEPHVDGPTISSALEAHIWVYTGTGQGRSVQERESAPILRTLGQRTNEYQTLVVSDAQFGADVISENAGYIASYKADCAKRSMRNDPLLEIFVVVRVDSQVSRRIRMKLFRPRQLTAR